jgi:3-oxoacyl-[acyl-carrier-protein] synthase II
VAESRKAVITGLGAVSPFGKGAGELWSGLSSGRRAIRPITLFPTEGLRNANAGEVPGYDPPASSEEPTRALCFLLDSADEALEDAGLGEGAFDPGRAATVVATNFGGMAAAEFALTGRTADLSGYDFARNTAEAAEVAGFAGPAVTLSLSCASGVAALVTALELIRAGRADVALAAGYDELSLFCYAGLSALRAVSTSDIIPFGLNRKGTIFSEGAGALVVESAEHAAARGARVHCELAGGAMNNDAYHMTAPEKEGHGIQRLMSLALADAGVEPGQVQHINLHGTGTKYNDLIETRAIKALFGDHAAKLVLTANKSMIGHTMGAAGLHESVCAVRSLTEGLVPPTVGISEPDPECDLDYCADGPRRVELDCVLKNSYGIGGTNASAVFRK